MNITLKDGSVKSYEAPMRIIDVAADLSEGLARVACAGLVDGEEMDLRTVIDRDVSLEILFSVCKNTSFSPYRQDLGSFL